MEADYVAGRQGLHGRISDGAHDRDCRDAKSAGYHLVTLENIKADPGAISESFKCPDHPPSEVPVVAPGLGADYPNVRLACGGDTLDR